MHRGPIASTGLTFFKAFPLLANAIYVGVRFSWSLQVADKPGAVRNSGANSVR